MRRASASAAEAGRVLVLAHVKELCAQNHEKYELIRGEAPPSSLFSAGLGQKCADGKVVFAGIQSAAQQPGTFGGGFSLVIIDECHRSAFGDWFGILEHFKSAHQLGLTAAPPEPDQSGRSLSDEEKRRDTYEYFGEPAYTYSLRNAIEDG